MCGAGQLLGAHRKSFIERVLENKSGEGKGGTVCSVKEQKDIDAC